MPWHVRLNGLGLSDRCNGNLQAWNASRQLGTLPGRRVGRKPPQPFLVHSSKVIFVRKNNSSADDLIQRTSCGLKNRLNVGEALTCLFLNGRAPDGTSVGVSWRSARNEHQAGGLYSLVYAGGGLAAFDVKTMLRAIASLNLTTRTVPRPEAYRASSSRVRSSMRSTI